MTPKQTAAEIKKILRTAGPMVRVPRKFFLDRLEITPAEYAAALDLIEAEGRVAIMRTRQQEGSVALA